MTKAIGTFACPICGYDKPHHHPDEQVAAYREDQVRNDGWISTAHRQPDKGGWYLCLGVEVPNDYGKNRDDGFMAHERWSQISWLNWVRSGGAICGRYTTTESKIQEVLLYDPDGDRRGWRLRTLLGNAAASGAESRFAVYARPKYWRELPTGLMAHPTQAPLALDADAGQVPGLSKNPPAPSPVEGVERHIDTMKAMRAAHELLIDIAGKRQKFGPIATRAQQVGWQLSNAISGSPPITEGG